MGVWIETGEISLDNEPDLSHPAWVCGLKPYKERFPVAVCYVTPCVGVWIETNEEKTVKASIVVTPCVGVWIETLCQTTDIGNTYGHTLRGCVD